MTELQNESIVASLASICEDAKGIEMHLADLTEQSKRIAKTLDSIANILDTMCSNLE